VWWSQLCPGAAQGILVDSQPCSSSLRCTGLSLLLDVLRTTTQYSHRTNLQPVKTGRQIFAAFGLSVDECWLTKVAEGAVMI